jgi:thymidylate kinase
MEKLDSKPIIIEFNGLPGSGKTTIARELKKQLDALGYKTTFSYFRRKIHRYWFTVVFNPQYWELVLSVSKFSKTIQRHNSFLKYLYAANYIRKYNDFNNQTEKNVLIIGQGFLQALISLSHQDRLLVSEQLDAVLRISGMDNLRMIVVNCNIKESVADSRITCRPKNGCRVESMGEDERMLTLRVQRENLDVLRKKIIETCPRVTCLDIDTTDSVQNCADEIMRCVKEII